LEALARELGEYESSVDLDPARLEEVRRRRDLLFKLTKKYGATLGEVIDAGRIARGELDLVDSAAFDLRTLEERERAAHRTLVERAGVLTATRATAAERLGREVDEVLPDLGMPDGRFHAALLPARDIGSEGAESVEFRV